MNKIFVLLIVFTSSYASAQTDVNLLNFKNQVNVFAPSPNAASLGKFGEIPVSEHTGIPNISVPIYSWKSPRSNIVLDISLGYHAGGIKVEDVASNVGLGWALNAGASVCRSVRGLPDDDALGYINSPALSNFNTAVNDGGYYHNPPDFPSEYIDMDTSKLNIIATFNTSPGDIQQMRDVLHKMLDGEQDIYYFSVEGQSGRFVLDKDGNAQKLDQNNVRIRPVYTVVNGKKSIESFVITSDRGVTYNLTIKESSNIATVNETEIGNNPFPNFSVDQPAPFISAFYASSIVDSLSKDTVYIDYIGHDIAYQNGFTESIEYHDNDDPYYYYLFGQHTANTINSHIGSYNNNFISQQSIKDIRLSDKSRIDFSYGLGRTDLQGDSALTLVTISDYLNNKKQYRLKYDYFDAGNYSLAFWALTNTASYSPYTVSANHFNKRLKLLSVEQLSSDGADSIQLFQFQYDSIQLPPRNSKAIDYWGYFVGVNRSSYTLIPQLNTPIGYTPSGEGTQTGYYYSWLNFFYEGADRTPDSASCKASALEKITNPTGGTTQFVYEANSVKGPIYPGSLKRSFQAPAETLTGNSSSSPNTITFNNRTDTGINFFIKFIRVDDYGNLYIPPPYDPNDPQSCLTGGASSANITLNVASSDGLVTKTATFNSVDSGQGQAWVFFNLPLNKTYHYSYSLDIGGNPCLTNDHMYIEMIMDYTSEVSNNLVGGIRIKSEIFFPDSTALKQAVVFNYNDSANYSTGLIPLIPNFEEHVRTEGVWSTCGGDTVVLPVFLGYADYKSRNSSTTQTLGYSFGGNVGYAQVTKSQVSSSSSLGKTVTQYSVADIRNYYTVFPYRSVQFIDWAGGHPLDEMVYDDNSHLLKKTTYSYLDVVDTVSNAKNRSVKVALHRIDRCAPNEENIALNRWLGLGYFPMTGYSELLSQRTAEYSGTDSLINTVAYVYDSLRNVISIQTTNSKGEQLSTDLYYPYNFVTTALMDLVSGNVLSQQVLQQNLVWNGSTKYQRGGGSVDFSVLTNGSVRPTKFYQYNTRQPVNITSTPIISTSIPQSSNDQLENQVTKYDDVGNPVEFLSKDGIRTSIIYGYKSTRPVAKIIGTTYDTAVSKLTSITLANLQLLTNPDTLRAKLDEIRQGFASNYSVQVSTYTYKPLFGLDSETDINNRTTYYEYDALGRLKVVRDQDKNILKTFAYQYQANSNQ